MKITFVANTRILGYRRGDVIELELEDIPEHVRNVLRLGRHLTMIDPLEFPNVSGASTDNPKEYRPFGVQYNGHEDSTSSGEREVGAAVDTGK